MTWKASSPLIEIAAASTAAACLGGAVGFAVARISPLGVGLVEAGVAGLLVALVSGVAIGRVDRERGTATVAALDNCLIEDVLLLDQRVEDDVLLLDEPLPLDNEDSGVVRLFAAQPVAAVAAPLAGPGEMIARIENFLGHAQVGPAGPVPARSVDRAAAEDASAALHAALADIRRSLRHG